VKPAIGGIAVLGSTLGAECKPAHCRSRTIVWDALHYGETRSAVGAVDKGITVPPVTGAAHFRKTLFAGRKIRTDQRGRSRPLIAFDYVERGRAAWVLPRNANAVDTGNWRGGVSKSVNQAIDLPGGSFDLYFHPAGSVAHEACESEMAGGPEDEWPEADSLNNAFHFQAQTLQFAATKGRFL
jgi:hypothetical protein